MERQVEPVRGSGSDDDDAWYGSEESTRVGMIYEIQRIRRRTRTHPIRVILLAAIITGGIMYKLATRKAQVEAEVVLALTEGSLSEKHNGIPVDELRQYVTGVLMPDEGLAGIADQHDLYPLRRLKGKQYAVEKLRDHLEVEIWKNTFRWEQGENERHSARIGITFADVDLDRAYDVANDLAKLVFETAQAQREARNKRLSDQMDGMRDHLSARLDELSRLTSEQEHRLIAARKLHEDDLVQTIALQLNQIANERKAAEQKMSALLKSRDNLAYEISGAGLDMSLSVVEEHKPPPPQHRGFVLVLAGVVIGLGSLLGSAMLLGAFDSRVHDGDDVERLGLPLLGHVPGFPGDDVGALATRGATARRVPSFERWRSHQ
jgi:capsular polysaccharide biosynthesis protein